MINNYDIKVFGTVSGLSLLVGFTSGYLTKKYLSSSKNKQKYKVHSKKNPITPPTSPHYSDNEDIKNIDEDVVTFQDLL